MIKKSICSLLVVIGIIFGITGCASFSRGVKDVTSDLSGGINRVVEVYDYTGNKIKVYEGKIDIANVDGNKVKFDINGKRYIIYNAIVIVEEQ